MPPILAPCLLVFWLAAAVSQGADAPTAPAVSLPAQDAVVVVATHDGRSFTGAVDARTDEASLWLRRDSAGVSLTVPVAWSEVATAGIDGESLAIEELKNQLAGLATRRSVMDVWSAVAENSLRGDAPCCGVAPDSPVNASRKVIALQVRAAVANWDADAQDDGIEIYVAPLDPSGRLAPARGELRVALIGARQTSRHGREYKPLKQWSSPVRVGDFKNGVAVYRMPFGTIEPEVDTDIGALGRIHVRLGVFGSGAFEATAPVRLRAFDPFGDELQLQTGRRFVREERVPSRRSSTPVGDGLFFSAPVGP